MSSQILQGDCVERMRELEEASIDAIVCDPPYSLSFMGKEWDKDLNHGPWATEALRVLKPGGHLLAFGGTRTYHRLACAIEDAGFEIRDSLIWLYGSGFPKSHNGDWGGTALKPGHEPIVMARKPLSGTVAQNVTEHGTGALNIDGCRIEGTVQSGAGSTGFGADREDDYELGTGREYQSNGRWPANVLLSHLPECEVVGTRKVKSSDARKADGTKSGAMGETWSEGSGLRPERSESPPTYASPDGTETIPAYNCAPGCPIAELDEQSGERASGRFPKNTGGVGTDAGIYGKGEGRDQTERNLDSGGASRFFPTFSDHGLSEGGEQGIETSAHRAARSSGVRPLAESGLESLKRRADAVEDELRDRIEEREVQTDHRYNPDAFRPLVEAEARFRYCAKASRGERNAGLDGERSTHPTVKPVDLMRWLVRLVTPPGGTVLDPFAGSGTTGVAAVLEGFDFLGIEREAEYAEIARARIEWWSQFPGEDTDEVLIRAGFSERLEREHREAGQMGLL